MIKTIIAYGLVIFGLPLAIATLMCFVLSLLLITIIKKYVESKKDVDDENFILEYFIMDFITETITGLIMVWLSLILFEWMGITSYRYLPLALSVPVILWNWERLKKYLGTGQVYNELAHGLGNIAGLIIGIKYLF